MAIFYVGPRPVLRGKNSGDAVHPITGAEGVYSNWDIHNTSHVLAGAPNNDHTPGTGYHPHGLTLTRRHRGLDTLNPLDNSGGGARIDGMRYRPLENKAAGNALVFYSGYGHIPRVTGYSQWDAYDDSDRFVPLTSSAVGHVKRAHGAAGTAATFGYFDHYIYKGVTDEPLEDTVQTVPTTYDNAYGRNRVNEWQGVTSAKALNVT